MGNNNGNGNNGDVGWVGEVEDVVELGERIGLWTRPSRNGNGGTLSPEEAREFLEQRGFGWLYEEGGPIDAAVRAQVNGLGGTMPTNGNAVMAGDALPVVAVAVGGVVITGFAAALILGALWLAKGRMG